MSIFAYIIIGLGIALAIVFKLFEEQIKDFFKENAKSSDLEEFPFYAKKVMTDPEQVLYHRLVDALPDYIVLAQVQLSRFLSVKKGFNSTEWNNRINRLSADFLICYKDSSIISVIELDDSSHDNKKSQETDDKKDKAIKSAEIKIIRWHVSSMPNKDQILLYLGLNEKSLSIDNLKSKLKAMS